MHAPAYHISELQRDPQSGLLWRQRISPQPAQARLLLLHGVGGRETDLLALAETIDARIEVLLLRGPLTLGAEQYGWFQVSFGAQGPQIDADQADTSRRTLISFLQTRDNLPTVIAGFSQGGIMSASLGLSAPRLVRGFAVLSGRILPELQSHLAAPAALSELYAFIAHGRYDDKLPVSWAERAEQWLSELGVRRQIRLYPMGHQLSGEEVADFNQWLAEPLALESLQ